MRFSGTYDKILSYVVSIDFIFFGLTGAALFRHTRPNHTVDDGVLRDCLFRNRCRHHSRGALNQRNRAWHSGGGRASLLAMDSQDSMKSDYMHWAKTKSRAKYNLATSGVPGYPLADLGATIEELEINGPGGYGYTPLREAIGKEYNVPVECIVPGGGTSGANMYAFLLLLRAGDEALVEFPTYEILPNLARFTGAKVNHFTRGTDVADAITPRTKLIVLTNLHNPTSALMEEAELVEIGRIAEKQGAYVLVDEVYLDCVWDRHVRSAFHLGPNFLVTSSLTKVYGLSGLRCGWIFAQPEIAERLWRLIDLFDNIPAHPAELLSVKAFEQLPKIRERSKRLIETNRETYRTFAEKHGLEVPAQGTVVFPQIADTICGELRDKYETTVVPGSFFGKPGHIRISLVAEPEILREGLHRLEQALESAQTHRS